MPDTQPAPVKKTPDRRRGVWVAYYPDHSSVTPHSSEVAALRDAVDSSQSVIFVPYGTSVADATRAARA